MEIYGVIVLLVEFFLPEEVAEVACFLLSDASKCISGEIIHCNASNHRKVFWNENE